MTKFKLQIAGAGLQLIGLALMFYSLPASVWITRNAINSSDWRYTISREWIIIAIIYASLAASIGTVISGILVWRKAKTKKDAPS